MFGFSGLIPRRVAPLGRALALALAVAALGACDSVADRVAARQDAGLAYVAAGEPGKALIEFEGALKLDPDFAPAYYQIARIHEDRGQFDDALAGYQRAAALDPGLLAARIRLGRLRLIGGDVAGAQAEADAVRAAAPDEAEGLALAAAVRLKEGDPAAARALIDRALAIAPDDAQVLIVDIGHLIRTGDRAAAMARLDAALARHPGEIALHAMKLGLLEQGGDDAALGAQLRAMVAAFPGEPRMREALVTWAMRAGDKAEAEAQLRALADAEPGNAARVGDLVRLILAGRGADAARAELEGRIAAAPARTDLRRLLADFELQTGGRERAVALLRDLAAGGGEAAAGARIRLARLYLEAGDEAAASAEIDAALAADPRNVAVMKLRIAQLIDRQDIDGAIAMIRAATEEAPEDAEILQLDGRAQEMAGNVDLANDRLAKAVRAAGYAPDVTERYVAFLRRTNRLAGAEAVLSEAVARAPQDARLLELLATTRIGLGNWAGAEKTIAALAPLDAARARGLRAAALIRQQRFDESGDLLRGAGDASVSQVVQSYLGAGQTAGAAGFLDDLIAQNPKNLQALGLRGALHGALGETDAAAARYRDVLAIDPANPAARAALARLAAARGDLAGGEAVIRDGLALTPDQPFLLGQLAQYREAQGDIEGAIGLYERIYRLAPDSLMAANNLASLLSDHHADDPAALRRAYAIASRLEDSPQPTFRDTFAWTRHLNGEREQARAVIDPVAAELPENPWVRYHAGMIHLALDEPEAARAHLEAALAAAGDGDFAPRAEIETRLAALRAG